MVKVTKTSRKTPLTKLGSGSNVTSHMQLAWVLFQALLLQMCTVASFLKPSRPSSTLPSSVIQANLCVNPMAATPKPCCFYMSQLICSIRGCISQALLLQMCTATLRAQNCHRTAHGARWALPSEVCAASDCQLILPISSRHSASQALKA